jgi:hypothetical protein
VQCATFDVDFRPSASRPHRQSLFPRPAAIVTPSNQAFDQSLSDLDPNWGLRDLEAVSAMAQSVGFSAPVITEMPANYLSVVFRRM